MSGNRQEDDASLFRQAMKNLGVSEGVHSSIPPVTPKAGKSKLFNPSEPDLPPEPPPSRTVTLDRTDPDQTVQFARAGITSARFKQLRRGKIRVEETIDLHGMRGTEAEAALEQFFQECLEEGLQTILLIHGKGRGSEIRGGVLKPLAIQWLKRQPEILAFCEALPRDGGSGALYVVLSCNSG